MSASRAGDGNITSAARHAETRSAFGAFEIAVLTIGHTFKKRGHARKALLDIIPKAQKRHIFLLTIIGIARKGAHRPYRKQ